MRDYYGLVIYQILLREFLGYGETEGLVLARHVVDGYVENGRMWLCDSIITNVAANEVPGPVRCNPSVSLWPLLPHESVVWLGLACTDGVALCFAAGGPNSKAGGGKKVRQAAMQDGHDHPAGPSGSNDADGASAGYERGLSCQRTSC
jgi:hypothetical protein